MTERRKIDEMMGFVLMIKENPAVLSKSQVPHIKQKKKKIKEIMAKELNTTVEKVQKKLDNCKLKVKNRCERGSTGNKPLLPWMKLLKELLDSNEKNPTYNGIPGAVDVDKERVAELPSPRPLSTFPESTVGTSSRGDRKRHASSASRASSRRLLLEELEEELGVTGLMDREIQRLAHLEQINTQTAGVSSISPL